ncbi:transmembrane protein 18-like [Ptychodera flava]|uniref:transmembrane protein 18-like n=1 Tax=Ptychodera flava TaxID=63121 RepID=UPI00396A0DCE
MAAPADAIRVDQIDGLWSFFEAIDWSEPFMIGLIVFHSVCLILTIATRQRNTIQAVYFFFLLVLVFFSETINGLCAEHYQKFSRLQYFDSNGLFISLVFSVPILANCLVIVVMWVLLSGQMLIKVKRAQLREQIRQQKEKKR